MEARVMRLRGCARFAVASRNLGSGLTCAHPSVRSCSGRRPMRAPFASRTTVFSGAPVPRVVEATLPLSRAAHLPSWRPGSLLSALAHCEVAQNSAFCSCHVGLELAHIVFYARPARPMVRSRHPPVRVLPACQRLALSASPPERPLGHSSHRLWCIPCCAGSTQSPPPEVDARHRLCAGCFGASAVGSSELRRRTGPICSRGWARTRARGA